jgi:predicted nucleic acid-binding protein
MFPDNTVLINFAIINRMDLLERVANGNGRWCATVAAECAASARRLELTALNGAGEIFGDPLFPDEAEHQDVLVLRDQLASPGDLPTQHLGEAETLAVILRRQLRCFFVTDDDDAARLAAKNGIQVVDTWRLLKVAHRKNLARRQHSLGICADHRTTRAGGAARRVGSLVLRQVAVGVTLGAVTCNTSTTRSCNYALGLTLVASTSSDTTE